MVNPLYQEVTRSRPIVKLFMATYLETISKPDQRLKAIRRIPWKGIANGQKKTNSYTVANDLARSG